MTLPGRQLLGDAAGGAELGPGEIERIRQFLAMLDGAAFSADELIAGFKSAGLLLLPGRLVAGSGAVIIDSQGIRLLQSTGVTEPDQFAVVGYVNKAAITDFFGRLGSYQSGNRATLHLAANEDPGFDPVRKEGQLELYARGLDGSTWTISGIEILTEADDVAASGAHKVARIFSNDSVSAVTREFLAAVRSFGAGGGPTRLSVNEQLEDIDFEVSGDSVETVLRVDASANQVIVNDQQGDADFRVHGDTIADVLGVDAGLDAAIHGNYDRFKEVSAPGTPASGTVAVYAKSDGLMYSKDDAGLEKLMSGGQAGERVLDIDRSETDVVNTSAETDVYSITLPGGTLGTNKTVIMEVEAWLLQNTGASRTMQFRVYYGSSSAAAAVDTIATNTVWRYARLTYVLSADGATNDQKARFGTFFEQTDTIMADFAVDSTSSQTMKITVDFDAASTNLILRSVLKTVRVMENV